MFSIALATVALPFCALAASLPAKTVAQNPNGTWLENIAVRPNGDLLVTQMHPSAIVYTLRDPSTCQHTLEEVVSIPGIQNIYGITQLPSHKHNVENYVIVGGNSSSLGKTITGTYRAWSIQLQPSRYGLKVRAKKISDMSKESTFLNGVVPIPHRSDTVLVADSANGLVGRLDLVSGKFDTSAFVFPEMVPLDDAELPIGVNGIRIHSGYLYFDNSYAASIYRIPMTSEGFPVKGATPELVVDVSNGVSFLDDFAFDAEGNIYAASLFDNCVVFADTVSGTWKIVVGGLGEMTVAGATSVAFGREGHDKDILYVTTSGAIANPVNGTETEGSKVVAIDTRPLRGELSL
ncbi:hypothetical protein FOCG_05203 [Fusarium oxysporum f. sp. radicis-lycopersici 26381]|uniref:SMP-30/Gluconolactonase/LRE-like region domain-containing protein n=1 Tax=Fusarium oxysporum Fo47 TaxID=660027 RepID=W9KBQ2_FUSOX|nr:uncharacterized protein FOBCDRAFT_274894 [Fusarium oxysporum Fo47]EWZ38813.1 hypothetical protein FOZG_10348 [Fusarium oxysporum Fo47]EXL58265.1 hypothetical protein FOCG_05203 [Fusarium oxysporum f. sp. radicis-lycopersici 26381]QKD55277.1 hypothetical protein FOBCDRAFT_274894 [Fusarium oxysporum Fo47]